MTDKAISTVGETDSECRADKPCVDSRRSVAAASVDNLPYSIKSTARCCCAPRSTEVIKHPDTIVGCRRMRLTSAVRRSRRRSSRCAVSSQCPAPSRSQFAASEDEKRLDSAPFHLTRGPLSVRRLADRGSVHASVSVVGSHPRPRVDRTRRPPGPGLAPSRVPRGELPGLDRASDQIARRSHGQRHPSPWSRAC